MGFLDKVKSTAEQVAKQGQELAKQGQEKYDDHQAKKTADRMLRDLGAWYYAIETGRDEGEGPEALARLTAELQAHEAEHGPLGADDDEDDLAGTTPIPAATAAERRCRPRSAAAPGGATEPMSVLRVGVFGAVGHMGTQVCGAVVADPDLELVAAVDPHHAGMDLWSVTKVPQDINVVADATVLADRLPDVMVDFTHHDAAMANLRWCADHGVHAVVGTTGMSGPDLEDIAAMFTTSNCIVAPNFAIGAILMMRFAELAAPWFDSAEIIELHHDQKVDAPSGTAMLTLDRMAAAGGQWAPDPTKDEVLPGARGADGAGGIRVHSVRLRGLVAHQEVLLGTTGQSLTIRHDSFDRSSFMPGVLLAVKEVPNRPGLTVGLDALLGL